MHLHSDMLCGSSDGAPLGVSLRTPLPSRRQVQEKDGSSEGGVQVDLPLPLAAGAIFPSFKFLLGRKELGLAGHPCG